MFITHDPDKVAELTLDTQEQMNYLYFPVNLPESQTGVAFLDGAIRLEERLKPFLPFIQESWAFLLKNVGFPYTDPKDYYCYLTAKIGWATTENPLNRPGWHVDAWGHPEDHNFVWIDKFPTRYIMEGIELQPTLMETDEDALAVFETAGRVSEKVNALKYVDPNTLYYFHQTCIHATPVIENPGRRRFVKVSFSPHKYNLLGNTHNYLLDYDWKMYDRAEVRNDPVYADKDFYDGVR